MSGAGVVREARTMFTVTAHQFFTPIVREIPRPAPDPTGSGSDW